MKEFVVYTGLRILLFFASLGVVIGVWMLIADQAHLLTAMIIAVLLSGIGSYFLLQGPREAFARRVEARAEAASARLEEMRSREDAD